MERTVETLQRLYREHVRPVIERKFGVSPYYNADPARGALVLNVARLGAQLITSIRTEVRRLLGELGIVAKPHKRHTELHLVFQPA